MFSFYQIMYRVAIKNFHTETYILHHLVHLDRYNNRLIIHLTKATFINHSSIHSKIFVYGYDSFKTIKLFVLFADGFPAQSYDSQVGRFV